MALSGYTEPAREYAKEKGIWLYEGIHIVGMIERSAAVRGQIAEYLLDDRKMCPACRKEMVIKTARKGRHKGVKFWGCSRFPKCKTKFSISDEDHIHLEDDGNQSGSPKAVWVPPAKGASKPRRRRKKREKDVFDVMEGIFGAVILGALE